MKPAYAGNVVTYWNFPDYFGDQLCGAELCHWVPGAPSVFFVLLIADESWVLPILSMPSETFSKLTVCSDPRLAPGQLWPRAVKQHEPGRTKPPSETDQTLPAPRHILFIPPVCFSPS